MTDRASIAAWLRREGYPDLAGEVERHADRERPAPTIPASEWMKQPSVGH